jgi:phage shock protein C
MEAFRRQGLVRPREGRILGGVCAGLARRFGIGPTMMRILFVVTLIVIPGSQIIVYPILWILMPWVCRADRVGPAAVEAIVLPAARPPH